MKHGRGIAFLDGVEDRPIPDIDAVPEANIGDDQDHKADGNIYASRSPPLPQNPLAPIQNRVSR